MLLWFKLQMMHMDSLMDIFLLSDFSNCIIQYLKFSQSSNTQVHNWNTTFTSAKSYVTVLTETATGDCTTNLAVTTQTATTFSCYAQNNERSKPLYAIAVGY